MIVRSRALYASTSAIALLASGVLTPASAIDIAARLSPTGLGQVGPSGGSNPAAAAVTGSPSNPNAQAQIALSAANLAKAAQAIKDVSAAQAAARASSQLTLNGVKLSGHLAGSAWNGAVLSGLKPVDDQDPTLWINADGLQKDAATATATVKQTAATALLNWQSFDLDKGETLVFDQQDHTDWTVLNRIVAGPRDPVTGSRAVASPSMILGKIQAPGSVYVINPNGIIFGPTAQINVHSLIASSLDAGSPDMSPGARDSFFLNTGILGNGGVIPEASFSYDARDTKVEGDVRIEAGAIITTSLAPRSVSPDAGGFVYLFAPNVENDGTIVTPAGETILTAAQEVLLVANAYPDGDIGPSQTFKAVGVNTATATTTIGSGAPIWRTDGPASAQISAPGFAINNGFIDAERGVVILNGDYVANGATSQDAGAVIRANTSVTRNGEIFLDARLKLTLNGTVQILPTENGETIPKSAIGSFAPGAVEMRGQTVDMEPGGLIVAPGASVSATALVFDHGIYPDPIIASLPATAARIYMAPGASIDVSGLDGVSVPMSANFVTFKPFGNEFADQPLQRQGPLRGQELTVDIRDTGNLNGVAWTGTPLADLAGFAGNIPQSIDQLLTTGGRVSFSAAPAGDVILRQGSAINVAGGYVQYEGGMVSTSKLITADGRTVDIAEADPLQTYVGVAGVSTDDHPKWGVTQTFINPLVAGGSFQPGYAEGHDAGGLTLNAKTYALDGAFYAGVVAGDRQRFNGQRPDVATANSRNADPDAMPSAGYLSLLGQNNLIISGAVTPLAAGFSVGDDVPKDRIDNTRLSAAVLSDASFGKLTANFAGHVDVTSDAVFTVVPGGTVSLAGGSVDIEGQIIAHSGTIAIEATAHVIGDDLTNGKSGYVPTQPLAAGVFDLRLGTGAVLDASGLWVNDANAVPGDLVGGAYIDGGTITLKTDSRSATCSSLACIQTPGLGASPIVVDLTGNIVVSAGSVMDVSSGGRVTDHGVIQLDSVGRPAGKGGNVSLQTYVGSFSTSQPLLIPTTTPLLARLVLQASDGTAEGNAQALAQAISANGFGQGGKLSIRTSGFAIGGAASDDPAVLRLPADFFAASAFGSYDLSATSNGITIAPDVTLTLRQTNLVADANLLTLPTGAKLSQAGHTAYLPDILRVPVNLTLSAALPPLPFAPYDPAIDVLPAQVAIRIGEGAVIEGDPGAAIAINVTGRDASIHDPNADQFPADIAQQIGVAEILGAVRTPGGTIAISGSSNSEIWLGAHSRLDVSGVAIVDARQPAFRTGTILPGGMVAISETDASASVVVLHGAVIDVSGAAGTFDLLSDQSAASLSGPQRVATELWSDAGSIAITTATLLYDGSFAAHAGAPSGQGGSLTINVPELSVRGEEITVRQSGDVVPDGLQSTDDLAKLLAAQFHDRQDKDVLLADSSLQKLWDFVFFQADRLTGSGITDLTLSASPLHGDTASSSQGKFAPGRIDFSGNVSIGGLSNLALDASEISLTDNAGHLLAAAAPAGPNGCNVCLDASYVALRGAGGTADNNNFLPQGGAGLLRVTGDTIDLAAGGFNLPDSAGLLSLSGIANASFVSTGDIRLRVPLANVSLDLDPGTLPAGEVITAGNLTLQAAQIYPISSVDITLKSLAADGTIAFGSTGSSAAAPLSAGGQVTVSAAHIVQGGTLLAPLGTIRLGAQNSGDLSQNDPTPNLLFSSNPSDVNAVRPTQSVTLAAGSTTSVSLAGQTVPYGRTANGSSWSYDSSSGQPMVAPPEKNLIVSGVAIDVAAGASFDVAGGGDIQAMEFVPGIGGTRDVLAGANVYAILPGYDPAAAPLDLDFVLPKKIRDTAPPNDLIFLPGDAVPVAGSKVFLSGEPGLPDGYYTLLPAHYATLPGAYRVSVVANSRDALAGTNVELPDGTLRMAGFFAQPGEGTQDSRTQFFDVQSSAVWRQYSEIDQTSGDKFFGAKTVGASQLPPQLPVDAGHAVFSAVSGLNLDGILHALPAAGGRGAQVDIAAQDIEILSPGFAARNDQILPLNVTQLSKLGAESLLIGGVRSTGSNGETITVVANAVELHNDSNTPLQAPEIILVTKAGATNGDINAGIDVRLDAGSVIRAVGEVADPTPKTVTIANAVAPDAQVGTHANGALLAVSNGAPITVLRPNAQTNGVITLIGNDAVSGTPGASIQGGSLTLDTGGVIRLNDGVTLAAGDIAISSRSINFGAVTGNPGGFVVADSILSQFKQADILTLKSGDRGINFYGNVDLTLARAGSLLVLDSPALTARTPGSVSLGAASVNLRNSADEAASSPAGSGSLLITAAEIELGSGDKALAGFARVGFAGSSEIALRETGSLDAGAADLNFNTPRFLVGSGTNQTVTTGGAASFAGPEGGASADTPEIGGILSVNAASVNLADNTLIQARAGGVTLDASAGDITLGTNARILANGYEQNFFDVTRVAPGGSVSLIADAGDIVISASAVIDVSSPVGDPGNAGSIALTAPKGHIASNGGAFTAAAIAGSVPNDSGGSLKIQAQTLGSAPVSIPALFSDTVDLHVGDGDLRLSSDLRAANVTLTADRGTLTIDHTIDASGDKGGTISLFGGRGVVLASDAALLATASDAGKHGGDVVLGTEVASANGSGADGIIDLQGGTIDVSNTANPVNGGTVRLRAPFLGTGGDNVPSDVAINTVKTAIVGASSVTIEAFKIYDTDNSAFNGIVDPLNQPGFFGGSCAASASGIGCSGTLINFVQNFALSSGSQAKFASIPSGVLHLQPGIELVNSDPNINNGDITIASAWNLGAGVAGPLYSAQDFSVKVGKLTTVYPAGTAMFDAFGNVLNPDFQKYKGGLIFAPGDIVIPELGADGTPVANADGTVKSVLIHGTSHISYLDYRVGGAVTGEPGTLTLRAMRDVKIGSSTDEAAITDGFFATRNVLDPTYQENLSNWLNLSYAGAASTNVSNVGGYLIGGATFADPVAIGFFSPGPAPVAPYDPGANAISPVFSAKDKAPLTGADLFPLISDPTGPIAGAGGNYRAVQSWSYRFVAGADTASANPLGLRPLSDFPDVADKKAAPNGGFGNVVIDGDRQYDVFDYNDGSNITYLTPTILRTGTGSIDIAAARDFILADHKAPGVVYTAGRNSVDLPDPGFALKTIDDPVIPGDSVTLPFAADPTGFLNPIVLACSPGTYFCNPYGPLGQSAYPVDGGHLTLTAQRDIIGYEHPTTRSVEAGGTGFPNQQYFAPWLLTQGTFLPSTDFGAFSPLSGYLSATASFTPSQTSWWINFGSFDQGLMSAGGDVRVEAGRDIQELAVSLPTTARVSGGLSNTIIEANGDTVANIPVVHLNNSGDLTVIAGRDLKSGAFYEGSGNAKIEVGGSVSASWLDRADPDSAFDIPVSTVLAVDTGTIALMARGDVDIAGIVSATSLQNVADSFGTFNVTSQSVSSYGPDSKVTLQSIAGDVTANSLSFANSLVNNSTLISQGGDPGPAFPGINQYPANFEAVALNGDVHIADSFRLAPSDDGTLNLLAYDSLRTSSSTVGTQPISSGASLVEDTFNPTSPLAGFGPAQGSQAIDLGSRLLHTNDSTPDLFYAANGDFVSGLGSGAIAPSRPLALELDKPVRVHAARDIVDLSFFGQNLAPADTTQIIAERDIYYTGAWQNLIGRSPGVLGEPENLGGLSLAGPGFFDVEAGRNLGPFVTAAGDITASTKFVSNPNGTGIVTFGNTVVAGNREMLSDHDPSVGDPFAQGANDKLPRQGASIVALFGVGKGIDYDAVVRNYIDPSTAISERDYAPDLADYLLSLGTYTRKDGTKGAFTLQDWENFSQSQDSKTLFNIFESLASPELQHFFADKVVFHEVSLTGDSSGCCFKQYDIGYAAIDTLFPPSLGYTDNRVAAQSGGPSVDGFGVFASTPAVRIATGDLEIFHATIKTLQGAEDFTVRQNSIDAATVNVGERVVRVGGTVTPGDVITETINDVPYSYTAQPGDTPDGIARGLRDAILAGAPKGIEVGAVGKGTSSFTLVETQTGFTFAGSTVSAAKATETIGEIVPAAIGGDINIFGPGGNINVGTTALEINPNLSNSSLGILTLNNGAIDIVTDGSVLVNQSRILTVQGGDILMWSSNVDIDAGRGAKTSIDFKPLSVDFDPRDLQTINLNGLVSGAGIGTIQSTPDAPIASAILVAPRGTVNFGDAGVRSSGNLDVAALVIANSQNAVVSLNNNALPTASVDLAGLESTSAVGGQAAQAAADAVAAAANQGAPPAPRPSASLISVEVLGFGDCDPESGMRCAQQP